MSEAATPSRIANEHAWLAGLLALCAIYLAWLGPRDWIPHDDGALAHAADRILQGEIPHRDFNEPYTGGLSYLHALAFEWFGTSLLSLRVMLGIFAMAFLAAWYRLALRFAAPPVAFGAALLAFAWSLPNYFVPLPSWYNLFFATFGTLALLRFAEDRRPGWLVVAGGVGGLSILFKIVGLYYFAAVLLALVYLEICGRDEAGDRTASETSDAGSGFRAFVGLGLLAFSGVVVALVGNRLTFLSALLFIVPSLSLSGWLLLLTREAGCGGRVGSLLRNSLVVLASGAAVLLAYAAIFASTSSLDALWEGTVSVVLRRLDYSGAPLPGFETALFALPFAALAATCFVPGRLPQPKWALGLLAAAGMSLVALGSRDAVYQGVWYAVRPLIPIFSVAAVVRLAGMAPSRRRTELFIVAAMTALLSLVQFPFSGGVYFCYVAPFVVLLGLALVETSPPAPRRVFGTVAASLGAFALLWLHTGSTYLLGERYRFVDASREIELPRAGISVRERDALFYMELTKRIERYSEPGDAIYASPDMPEVYFLGDRRNPTRSFFDSTDADYFDVEARDARIIATLREADIAFAILGRASEFSRAPTPTLHAFLAEQLPHQERMAGYLMRWRDPR